MGEPALHQQAIMNSQELFDDQCQLYDSVVVADDALARGLVVQGRPASPPAALLIERQRPLDQDPPDGKPFWKYSPTDKIRLAGDVLRVSANGSFASRVLLALTNDGESKHFEMLTGEDGLTFGITDFAGSGCEDFFKAFNGSYPNDFRKFFGKDGTKLLSRSWLRDTNIQDSNAGLIRLRWVREGLAQLLAERRFHGFQLAHFVRGKIKPALATFRKSGFRRELTLGIMLAIANTLGPSALAESFLPQALRVAGSGSGTVRELAVAEWLLDKYTRPDRDDHPLIKTLLRRGFGHEEGKLPTKKDAGQLGHRGRRARLFLSRFPVAEAKDFAEIGTFVLATDERFNAEPATA